MGSPGLHRNSFFVLRCKRCYPMSSRDLQQSMESNSSTGWHWTDTNGWGSAQRLHPPPPLDHLYNYVLASDFLIPMQIPADLQADAATINSLIAERSGGDWPLFLPLLIWLHGWNLYKKNFRGFNAGWGREAVLSICWWLRSSCRFSSRLNPIFFGFRQDSCSDH